MSTLRGFSCNGTTCSTAHKVLACAAGNSRSLKIERAKKVLQSAPGFTFGSGRTSDDLLKDLSHWRLIEIESTRIQIRQWR